VPGRRRVAGAAEANAEPVAVAASRGADVGRGDRLRERRVEEAVLDVRRGSEARLPRSNGQPPAELPRGGSALLFGRPTARSTTSPAMMNPELLYEKRVPGRKASRSLAMSGRYLRRLVSRGRSPS
jgi:hypothetical protein